ncbi:DUF3566 domain-containing protein [Allostreptomyces psammosilenae]|uniref:DUF3566 domain-containing protein n=1 Tax=Allostreptomyces psammosilenae TaxID=1892865 RepID=A0A852ZUX5_9ACTN|nr:DUF3566 domain-containing protein [Allostreptomyces psammosilenae]NYI05397.1 hypothetical protein [Allostreptomyces psammosilenae]
MQSGNYQQQPRQSGTSGSASASGSGYGQASTGGGAGQYGGYGANPSQYSSSSSSASAGQGYQSQNYSSGGYGSGSAGAATTAPARPTAQPTAGQPPAQRAGQPSAAARPATGGAARTRKARLRVSKVDPWSVMKVSFLLSIAIGVVAVVAVALLWMVLDSVGVFQTVGETMREVTGSQEGDGMDLLTLLAFGRVMTITAVVAVIDVVLATALATIGAFIYNIAAQFVGGLEVTLAEED